PPRPSAAWSTQDCSASPSATSATVPKTVPPRSVSAFSAAATSPAVRAQKPTAAPSSTNASTIARPIPLVPPVTIARLPGRFRSIPAPPCCLPSHGPELGRPLPQFPMHAAEGLGGRQQRLAGLHRHAVVRVHHVGDGHLGDLGQQLVRVHRVQAV